jgi:hypothetical protein
MISIDDPDLPGLAGLDPEVLSRITGSASVSLIRMRYRRGERAILHVGMGADGEGALLFFRGDKARKLATRNLGARYDPQSGALFEPFPQDHRMPQIRQFLEGYAHRARRLVGGAPLGRPKLLRYRPGLSCTFRCQTASGDAAYIKLLADESPRRMAVSNRLMNGCLAGSGASLAPAIAFDEELSAVSYREAAGCSLDRVLAKGGGVAAIRQAIAGLQALWRLPVTPSRHLSRAALLGSAASCAALVETMVPECANAARRILCRLESGAPLLAARPIHADVKLEHIFLNGASTALIDTESISLGSPDYDLAQLFGRLWQAECDGLLPAETVSDAAGEVRRSAGPAFDWCRDVVALRLARFHAQRPAPGSASRIAAIFARIS